MILVTVGTNEARFDRLLGAIAELASTEELVIQYGHSTPPHAPAARLVDFLPYEEMVQAVRTARAMVTHAGVGSVMVALANQKRPIVVPRRRSFGEAVDDHQLQLGRRFARAGLVTLVEAPEGVRDALALEQTPAILSPHASHLASDLTAYLESVVRRPRPAARP
jgi:UDP-N-acetylglucosamine transferase subunit ALG13